MGKHAGRFRARSAVKDGSGRVAVEQDIPNSRRRRLRADCMARERVARGRCGERFVRGVAVKQSTVRPCAGFCRDLVNAADFDFAGRAVGNVCHRDTADTRGARSKNAELARCDVSACNTPNG